MGWRHLLFDTLYRLGQPIWDTPPPEKLRDLVEGYDALLAGHDMGCYHSLPDGAKLAYVAELASVMKSGAPLVKWEGIRIKPGEIPAAFNRDFVIESVQRKDFTDQAKAVAPQHHRSLVPAASPLTCLSQMRSRR